MKTIKTTAEMTTEQLKAELARRESAEKAQQEMQRKAYEGMKAETILSLCTIAEGFSSELKAFKKHAFESMQSLYVLLQEYSSRHNDGKGNFRIEEGDFRISYSKHSKGTFDERAYQAERHINDFITEHFEDDMDTKDLIMSLLERKKGELDINLIQKLYQMENRFENENWKLGIALLKESYTYAHSKDYIRFEKRNKNGEWQNINLQFSNI